MSDRQLVAFSGQPNGEITRIDWRLTTGPNHVIIRQPGDFTHIVENVGDIDADPAKWEDALKLSGCINLTVNAGVVRGGREDVLDVMRCRHCTVNIEDAYPRGNFVSTQKGQSEDITLKISRQHGHGKEVDHDYGNNAPGNNGYTKGCKLSVNSSDGRVVVRVLRATAPQISGAPHEFAFPKPSPEWLHAIVIFFLNKIQ